jgi:hypothetical protein
MKVDAVLYFNVVNPERAIIQVQNYLPATNMLAQTTLRAVLGQHELDEMLSERKKLSTVSKAAACRRQFAARSSPGRPSARRANAVRAAWRNQPSQMLSPFPCSPTLFMPSFQSPVPISGNP